MHNELYLRFFMFLIKDSITFDNHCLIIFFIYKGGEWDVLELATNDKLLTNCIMFYLSEHIRESTLKEKWRRNKI